MTLSIKDMPLDTWHRSHERVRLLKTTTLKQNERRKLWLEEIRDLTPYGGLAVNLSCGGLRLNKDMQWLIDNNKVIRKRVCWSGMVGGKRCVTKLVVVDMNVKL